jgi:predicted transcriptional regulator
MKRKYQTVDYPPDKFGIIEYSTGEVTNFKNGKLTYVKPTNQVSMNYNNYLLIDTDILKRLQKNGITDVEMGLLVLMSSNLAFNTNVAMNVEGKPHTASSIAEMIGQTQQAVLRKLKKLEERGIIKKTYIPGHKEQGKVYAINPYVMRRGKNFAEFLDKIFFDIAERPEGSIQPLLKDSEG